MARLSVIADQASHGRPVDLEHAAVALDEIYSEPDIDEVTDAQAQLMRKLRTRADNLSRMLLQAMSSFEFGELAEHRAMIDWVLEEQRIYQETVAWADTLLVTLVNHGPAALDHVLARGGAADELRMRLEQLNRHRQT